MAAVSFATWSGAVACVSAITIGLVVVSGDVPAAEPIGWGGKADVTFAARLWKRLEADRLVGPKRINSGVLKGRPPHGLQQVLASMAAVDGRSGRVIVKMSYEAPENLTQDQVWNAPDRTLAAYTVMFMREAGYDPPHRNWFWVKYTPDGKVGLDNGRAVAGRVGLPSDATTCIGCHETKGEKDLEVFTPQ